MYHFIINSKNYKEASGPSALKLSAAMAKVSQEAGIKNSAIQLYLAAPAFSISEIASNYPDMFILTQHLDSQPAGSTTGYLVPEIAMISGAKGSLLNHSEHRISAEEIQKTVEALRILGMKSVVCARDALEVGRYARFNPDYIAIEPPELIGSGRAVSKERPELISDSKTALHAAFAKGQTTELLCGAGIVDRIDVRRAVELGANGILVASGVIKSSDWIEAIRSLASGFF